MGDDGTDDGGSSLAGRIGARFRAARLAHHSESEAVASAADEGPAPIRVLLFGTGVSRPESAATAPNDDPGARTVFELEQATGRAVRLDALLADEWEPPDPMRALREQGLDRYDAIIVISTYRRNLVDVPVDAWLGTVVEVREFIVRSARPDAIVQVLNLPWQAAADDAPDEWGGAVGRHIRTLDTLARASLDATPDVLQLTLAAPADASEWIGPVFSTATYRRWAVQIGAQLAERLRLATDR